MAHNIEVRKINGAEVASYVENGRKERAWHNLGQVYDGQISVKEALEQSFEHLQNIRLSEKQLDDILSQVILTDANLKQYQESGINAKDISSVGRNQFLAIKNSMERGIGQDLGERGTAMWALNGLTTYFQNERNYRNEELKLDSVLQGHAANKLQQAYDLMIAV